MIFFNYIIYVFYLVLVKTKYQNGDVNLRGTSEEKAMFMTWILHSINLLLITDFICEILDVKMNIIYVFIGSVIFLYFYNRHYIKRKNISKIILKKRSNLRIILELIFTISYIVFTFYFFMRANNFFNNDINKPFPSDLDF